jgi:hypothetical protein
MTRPTKRVHNLATDTVVDVELTDEEFEIYKINVAEEEAKQAEAEAKAAARAALLAQLGITEEQAKLLLGGN